MYEFDLGGCARAPRGGKKEQEGEEQKINGYGSSVVAAVNFSTEVCFDF